MMAHQGLTQEHWNKYSFLMQLANTGTDFSRAMRWKNEGNTTSYQGALGRAFELLDLTITDPKNKIKGRLKELTRMRETTKDYFLGDNQYHSTDKQWEDYFYAFCYAAAIERGR